MLSMSTTPVGGWWGSPANHHGAMTRDALEGLGWTDEKIGSIPEHANLLDRISPHPENSCHRILIYQEEFERYGGDNCTFPGAEWYALTHLVFAGNAYNANDVAEGQKHLGYAIHYIQDAFCPPHIFPFREGDLSAHTNFEAHTDLTYNASYWPTLVRQAQPISVENPDDLRTKIVQEAGLMRAVTENYTSYVREDGESVGDPPLLKEWNMSHEHIGMWMEKAASLVKGAALWATRAYAWPMYQHDPQRTGRSPYAGPASPTLKAQTLFEVAPDTITNVAIDRDATIYFAASAGGRTGLFALYPNGTEKWFLRHPLCAAEGGHPTLGPDGTIYALSQEGVLAVNSNGTPRWERPVAILYRRQHFATSADGRLYFVAGVVLPSGSVAAPCLVALDADGRLVWVFDMQDETVLPLSPDYDMKQGWGGSTATNEVTSPSIGPEGNIYVGYDGTLWSITSGGTINWDSPLGPAGAKEFQPGGPVISSSGTIYVVSTVHWISPPKVYAVSSQGSILWESTLGGLMYGHPAIGPDGTLYIFHSYKRVNPDWLLTALDAQLNLQWEEETGDFNGIPLVDTKGNVFVAGENRVLCFTSNLSPLWSVILSGEQFYRTGLAINQEGTLFVPGAKLHSIQERPHDTAITSVTASKTIVGRGDPVQIEASIANEGDFHENFSVSTYANTTLIEIETDNLQNGTSKILTFTWDTADTTRRKSYTIHVYTWPVQGEKDSSDNAYTDGTVLVTIRGDVNGDRWVDAFDLSDFGQAYSATCQHPNCDFDGNGKVDAQDLYSLSRNYGQNA